MRQPKEKKAFPTIDDLMADFATIPDIQYARIGEAVLWLIVNGHELTLDAIKGELERAASGEKSTSGQIDHAAKAALELISAPPS